VVPEPFDRQPDAVAQCAGAEHPDDAGVRDLRQHHALLREAEALLVGPWGRHDLEDARLARGFVARAVYLRGARGAERGDDLVAIAAVAGGESWGQGQTSVHLTLV
jgi:hypothetical protein